MRQVVLDTETTGLEPSAGHRIIEIGCVEVINRKLTGRHYHQYIRPNRDVDQGAIEVHGITNEFLADKPLFESIYEEFIEFVSGAELVIHNAPFDVGFIDHEFALLRKGVGKLTDRCTILDTLALARNKHPGQKNNLDALCKRYFIDNSQRDLHGALLDAEILADVYLTMTGGQTKLHLGSEAEKKEGEESGSSAGFERVLNRKPGLVLKATEEELERHQQKLETVQKASGACMWLGTAES